MRKTRYIICSILFLLFFQISLPSFSQLGISFDIKKPRQYEERVLKSEKSDQKKFNLPRRLIQNTVTHYNYFFNANNKLNEVIERAKTSHKDDYSELLPFYNYDLNVTSQDRTQLDSVISKSMAGIVLHDLRNDWIDNMYLLWGAAYYLRKEFDSAYLTFQFINYAFAQKEKDGYYRYIGSKIDGNNALSIATRENNSLPKKVFSEPPSRNDAFIWQIRTFIAKDEFTEAASLIETLKSDPVFPKRLNNDLEEVQAWWFYKQNMFDSAAFHLNLALDNATNKQEKARWEYLIAQLYERSGKHKEAERFYAKAINHTTDPVLEIYARLNSIRTNKDGGENYIDKNIAELIRMAKRDKYRDYRDIIYFMAAQMELERNNFDAAQALLLKGTQFNNGNDALRNKAFLQLGELAFAQKRYRPAYNYYDSLRLSDPALVGVENIKKRKELLGRIATNIEVIHRQDSLQRIANLPEKERNDLVKALVKQIRKQQGLKDESSSGSTGTMSAITAASDIFPASQQKGEWYFYNTSLRSGGVADFKSRWGNRPNVDNWRRASDLTKIRNVAKADIAGDLTANQSKIIEISFDALNANLPLTAEKIKISNDSIQDALYSLGNLYNEEIEDCNAVIETLETLRTRFPEFPKMDEVLFKLYYCHYKSGGATTAAQLKKLLIDKYPTSNYTSIIETGKDPRSKKEDPEVTKKYESIYDLFIDGKFSEALEEKKKADSLYGENYWTPQQMYIESVYYIKERQDSTAISILNKIVATHNTSPLAARATNLIDVLGRRQKIEEELTNLQTERPLDDVVKQTDTMSTVQPVQVDTVSKKIDPPKNEDKKPVLPGVDTVIKKPIPVGPFTFIPDGPHYVVVILNKVDGVFGNEAKNALSRYNREKFYTQPLDLNLINLDAENKLLLISMFANAQAATDYVQKTKPLTSTQIMPWLKPEKYSYTIINDKNLELLKANPDISNYKKFLEQFLPGKF